LAGSFLEKDNTEFRLEENSNDNAYLLYTSGSTGEPKGIVVSHENLNAFFNNVLPKYDITTSDRISQFFDFTFDPSIHDMFLAWNSGAVLVCVPDEHLIAPHKFIIQNDITFWSSVPSVGRFLRKLRVLKSGVFPQLRYTLFTGEALPFEVYSSWKEAASNSVIINGYGPTELTMNISDFWIPDDLSLNDCYNGIVPIGFVFSDHIFVLMENDMISTDKGELLISGPQQVNGYFNDPDRTKESFIYINNRRYYKTGDIVLSNIDGLKYLGRLDNQVQIRGFRVELSEIEYALKIMRISESVAIGYPRNTNIVERIVLFVANYGGTVSEIVSFLKDRLPEYMIPTNIVLVDSFPLTVNGKLDKNELYNRINDGKH
jgi:non-ribosomal peptide synthetase component F